MKTVAAISISFVLLVACSTQKQIGINAKRNLLGDKNLATAHIGIAVYDPVAGKYLYNYQGEKYFTPASNTKLFTLYAGLKYLPDSLVAARYKVEDETVLLQATGDPTFLHPDFPHQPLLTFLQQDRVNKISINTAFATTPLGMGWAWDDYKEPYMAERDPFPMYGNVMSVTLRNDSLLTVPPSARTLVIGSPVPNKRWEVNRTLGAHFFSIDTTQGTTDPVKKITLSMERGSFAALYLADTLHKEVTTEYTPLSKSESTPIYSQPKDSVFKLMMHRSDNFFAEQTLLMVGNEKLTTMNDEAIIDTLLQTDLRDLPQKPRWVDGSGLSRYNLFSPEDFIAILKKMHTEFGATRMQVILPGANEGTLEGLYKGYENHIYAKTGTLSNNVALSGYIITKKNKSLYFSILVNHHTTSAAAVRIEIEKFITTVIDRY